MQNFDCKFLFQHTVLIKSELIVGVPLENCCEKLTNLTNFSKKGLYRRHYFTVNFTKFFRENSLWNTSKWLLFENFVYRFMLNQGHVMIYCIVFATLYVFMLFFFFFFKKFWTCYLHRHWKFFVQFTNRKYNNPFEKRRRLLWDYADVLKTYRRHFL